MKPEVGKVYTLAGLGEMLCVAVKDMQILIFEQHSGYPYYAIESQILRVATAKVILARHAEAAPRGVACTRSDCWCQRFHETE